MNYTTLRSEFHKDKKVSNVIIIECWIYGFVFRIWEGRGKRGEGWREYIYIYYIYIFPFLSTLNSNLNFIYIFLFYRQLKWMLISSSHEFV